MDWYVLGPFLMATILVVLAPGPVTAIVAHNTLRHGRASGLLTVVGVELGELCLLAATLTGVAVSAELFPLLFRWLGVVGVLYLLWSCASELCSRTSIEARQAIRTGGRQPVVAGLTVAFANPATIVFYAAFFRQFLHPDRPVVQQAVVLGTIYLVTAFLFDLVLVLALARIRLPATWAWLAARARLGTAAVYIVISAMAVIGLVNSWS